MFSPHGPQPKSLSSAAGGSSNRRFIMSAYKTIRQIYENPTFWILNFYSPKPTVPRTERKKGKLLSGKINKRILLLYCWQGKLLRVTLCWCARRQGASLCCSFSISATSLPSPHSLLRASFSISSSLDPRFSYDPSLKSKTSIQFESTIVELWHFIWWNSNVHCLFLFRLL